MGNIKKERTPCDNGCYDRPPFICTCLKNIRINNPINPVTLREEMARGAAIKSGFTLRKINDNHSWNR